MTKRCPNGHRSETTDYCGECGSVLVEAPSGAEPESVEPESVVTGSAVPSSTVPGSAVPGSCPNCGSLLSAGSTICGECGFDLGAPDSVALWESQLWEITARPDREYYEMLDPDGMEFPESLHTARVALTGDHARIGRRSVSRGIVPDIDLSGALEDIGVSHRHAVLMRQPDGSWSLVDQDSTNGTYLNADLDPVAPNHPVPLRDGDRIHVGAWTTLTIERVDVDESRPFQMDTQASKDTRGVARARRGDMEFGLLGPLTVAVGGAPVVLGSPKVRAVMTVLALHIGAPVGFGDFEWALWGDEAPRTADKALQGYISTLRRVLPQGAIETTAHGYRLIGPKAVVDFFRFDRATTRGHDLLASGHPGSAVAELGRALALWRGEPLPDLADGPVGATEVARLRERRAGAEEDLFEGRLELGDHQGAVPELLAAVEAEPLRERRWAQLMLALHRSGRQVDALRAFQRLRTLLGEEHGAEPSTEIVTLERAIVLDKPELRWTPPSEAGGDPQGR